MPLKVGVNGAGGRMGQRIVALTMKDPDLSLTAALEWSGCPLLGRDAGEVAGRGAGRSSHHGGLGSAGGCHDRFLHTGRIDVGSTAM